MRSESRRILSCLRSHLSCVGLAATASDGRPAVADTHSGKAAARADVQAQPTGTHGRTLRHGPTEACQSPREAALMMQLGPGWLVSGPESRPK
jgi:hypothetical protein